MGKKITHKWRRWGTTQNFFLASTDKLEKQIFIKENCWSGPIKNKIIFIFTMLQFKKKIINKEKQLEISLFYILRTKTLDDVIYSSWGIEQERLTLLILGHFYPPKNQKNIFKNWKKLLEISSFYSRVPKITII